MTPKFDALYEMLIRTQSDRTDTNEERWLAHGQEMIDLPTTDAFNLHGENITVRSEKPGYYYFFVNDELVAFYEGNREGTGIETKMIFTKKGRFKYSFMYYVLKWVMQHFSYIKTGMVASTDSIKFITKNFDQFVSEGYTFTIARDYIDEPETPLTDISTINQYATPQSRIKIYPPKS
jgi:hypothetical protein